MTLTTKPTISVAPLEGLASEAHADAHASGELQAIPVNADRSALPEPPPHILGGGGSVSPAASPPPVQPPTVRRAVRAFWLEWLRPFLLILTVLLTFRSVVADWNHVPSGSMRPTILEGDRIFVNKIAYDLRVPFTTRRIVQWSEPDRGDVVVFLSPADGKRLVKRVVGLPGDRIELRSQRLWINNRPATYQRVDTSTVRYLNEAERNHHGLRNESLAGGDPHLVMTRAWRSSRSTFSPMTLGQNQYFVMGDNRDDSADSRVFGTLDRHLILGRATGVAMSVDPTHRYRPRWDRFFQGL